MISQLQLGRCLGFLRTPGCHHIMNCTHVYKVKSLFILCVKSMASNKHGTRVNTKLPESRQIPSTYNLNDMAQPVPWSVSWSCVWIKDKGTLVDMNTRYTGPTDSRLRPTDPKSLNLSVSYSTPYSPKEYFLGTYRRTWLYTNLYKDTRGRNKHDKCLDFLDF